MGAPLDQLVDALRRHRPAWSDLGVGDLEEMIRRSEKKRYEIRGGRIRALYGHSLPERLEKEPTILRVDAGAAHADGVTFYAGNEKVWLSERVPGEYLETA